MWVRALLCFLGGILVGFLLLFLFTKNQNIQLVNPLAKEKVPLRDRSLDRYAYANLRASPLPQSSVTIGKVLKEGDSFTSYLFNFTTDGKNVSGLMNIPIQAGTYPIIVMLRGFVDRTAYTTGEGTRRSAEAVASAGFITLAPDFLGYGDSDNPSARPIEERFQTYTTTLSLFSAIPTLNDAFREKCYPGLDSASQSASPSPWLSSMKERTPLLRSKGENDSLTPSPSVGRQKTQGALEGKVGEGVTEINESVEDVTECKEIEAVSADTEHIGIWGHSNGGQIALSILEITGKDYPTVLWAPVSKPFPYSILYFTDDFDDYGKALRKVVAKFEEDYDVDKYSLTTYLDWIKAPLQLHQGSADESVPQRWSDQLYELLQEKGIDVSYFVYPGENHNFNNGHWPTAIQRSIAFYKEWFGN